MDSFENGMVFSAQLSGDGCEAVVERGVFQSRASVWTYALFSGSLFFGSLLATTLV